MITDKNVFEFLLLYDLNIGPECKHLDFLYTSRMLMLSFPSVFKLVKTWWVTLSFSVYTAYLGKNLALLIAISSLEFLFHSMNHRQGDSRIGDAGGGDVEFMVLLKTYVPKVCLQLFMTEQSAWRFSSDWTGKLRKIFGTTYIELCPQELLHLRFAGPKPRPNILRQKLKSARKLKQDNKTFFEGLHGKPPTSHHRVPSGLYHRDF